MPSSVSSRAGSWSDGLAGALHRRLAELSGLALILIAAAAAVALASWSALDPSFNLASDGPTRNLLGRPGAIFADFLMQLIGLAAVVFILPLGVWGWRILTHRPLKRIRIRLVAWFLSVVFATGLAACIKSTLNWPLSTGLGGISGDLLLGLPTLVFGGALPFPNRLVLAALFALLAIAPLAVALGLGFTAEPEPETDDDAPGKVVVSLGALTHGLLAFKARLFGSQRGGLRSLFKEMLGRDEEDLPMRTARREPMLDADDADFDRDEPEPRRRAPRMPPAPKKRRAPRGRYELPPLDLLAAAPKERAPALSASILEENAEMLENVLEDFGVRGEIVNASPGPVVTLYELEPAPGIKSSRVIGLADDIARSMSAVSARVAVVPGRNAIGIELPNPKREKVVLRELLAAREFTQANASLPLCLGKTIGGDPVIVDLARMPHLLIAGTTGSGKSVAINTMILSLLYRLRPEECRLILIDPKMLELSVYDGIPHLLAPVVTDPKKAIIALKWTVREMEERYKKMSKVGVRNIDGYNARVAEAREKGQSITRTVQTGFDKETGEAVYERQDMELDPLPFVVVVVDEMADLMMVAGKDIEGAIQRLAQMARAAGIHLVMATQRPSVDVITGTIKANFPTRVSFQVTSKIDSRTILGEQGAEQLLGQGDMLYMAGGGRISRVHGPFVSDREVEHVVAHLKEQGAPEYLEAVTAEEEEGENGAVFDNGAFGEEGGADLYKQAVQIVLRDRKASTSYVQRRLQIGYNRAATIIERMEKEGIVGPANHAGKREILVEGANEPY
ncbi:MAG TPA: DNA translocase FtsK 4TM domain-containing protein [Xanthobacteraceae bacterium]|nr:DNA translocase FtsK 4TM domain-containing protein [Xanthobacteraceae bacterium]